jgi:hypothetical protein
MLAKILSTTRRCGELVQGGAEQAERMQRLTQVMACGSEKLRLREARLLSMCAQRLGLGLLRLEVLDQCRIAVLQADDFADAAMLDARVGEQEAVEGKQGKRCR